MRDILQRAPRHAESALPPAPKPRVGGRSAGTSPAAPADIQAMAARATGAPIEAKRIDAGYRDLVEAARSDMRPPRGAPASIAHAEREADTLAERLVTPGPASHDGTLPGALRAR